MSSEEMTEQLAELHKKIQQVFRPRVAAVADQAVRRRYEEFYDSLEKNLASLRQEYEQLMTSLQQQAPEQPPAEAVEPEGAAAPPPSAKPASVPAAVDDALGQRLRDGIVHRYFRPESAKLPVADGGSVGHEDWADVDEEDDAPKKKAKKSPRKDTKSVKPTTLPKKPAPPSDEGSIGREDWNETDDD